MKIGFIFGVLSLLGAVVSCTRVVKQIDNTTTCMNISWQPDKNTLVPDSVYAAPQFALLDISDRDGFFTAPSRVVAKGGRFYIFDLTSQNAVYVFDRTGRFLHRAGRKGGGPGEYNRLINFTVDGQDVYLLDNTRSKLLHFAADGQYVNNWDTPSAVEAVERLDNGCWIFAGRNEGGASPALIVTDSNMQVRDTVLLFQSHDTKNFLCSESFQRTDRGLLFNHPICDTLYLLDAEGNIAEKIFCDFGSMRLPDVYRPDYMKTAEALMNEKLNQFVYFSKNPIIKDHFLIGQLIHGRKYDSFTLDMRTGTMATYQLDGRSYDPSIPVFPRALSDEGEVVSLVDPYSMPMNPDADVRLPDSVKQHVLKGGTAVILHKIKVH